MRLVLIVAKSGESMKSGPMGLAVILVLCVVAYFLFKSMSKHLRRVREEFPVDDAPEQSAVRAPRSAHPPATAPAPNPSARPATKPPAANQPSDGDSPP